MKTPKQSELNEHLLVHDFEASKEFSERYMSARLIAEHYCRTENAVVVLSNMADNVSLICYGRLGKMLQLGQETEEVESIWEKKILDRIHPDDMAEKIAWELQFLSLMKQTAKEERPDYYLQHYLRIENGQGEFVMLRHRIFYLDYDNDDNVRLALCLYTAHNEQQATAGIYCSLDDTRVKDANHTQGLLSEREREVLGLIGRGMASKQIADTLCISTNTVNNHRQNILRKMQCQNTTEALSVARKLGILGE